MYSRNAAGTPVSESTLVVPDVEQGDIGLVVAVQGFFHDVDTGRWWVVVADNRVYRLPVELNEWASMVDAKVKRKFLNLPKVFAFASLRGDYQVRILSMV